MSGKGTGWMGTLGLCESHWGSLSMGGQERDLRQRTVPKRPEQLLFGW